MLTFISFLFKAFWTSINECFEIEMDVSLVIKDVSEMNFSKLNMCLVLVASVLSLSAFAGPYDNILAELRSLQSKYPHLATMISMGANDQGVDILGLKIERGLTQNKTPKLVVGTHHGNETDAAPLSVSFARELLKILDSGDSQYFSDLKSDVFYVFPVLNISGYDRRSRREKDSQGRWLDPNRDYPDACAKKADFQLKSVRNLSRFIYDYNIVGAITVHGYVGTLTFPWGFYTDDTHSPDHEEFMNFTRYAVQANNYRVGTHKDVIYPASGSFEDWAYLEQGVWVALLEMKRRPDYSKDVEAMLRYFSVIPKERSFYHDHDGNCVKREGGRSEMSRP